MSIFKRSNRLEPIVILPKEPEYKKDLSITSGRYTDLFNSMVIKQSWKDRVNAAADKVLRGKMEYQWVGSELGIPWIVPGVLHLMESDCNFKTHLHNGDSLSARTINVPKGRPKTGKPPFTWRDSALDALVYDKVKPPLNTIELILNFGEGFNGWGYRKKGIESPYIWSGSEHYSSGKYVSDGVWSKTAVSSQVGIAPVIKVLINRKEIII